MISLREKDCERHGVDKIARFLRLIQRLKGETVAGDKNERTRQII